MTAIRESVAEEAPVQEGTAKRGFLYPGMALPFCLWSPASQPGAWPET